METGQNKSKRSAKKPGIVALLILAFVVGFAFHGLFVKPASQVDDTHDQAKTVKTKTIYTCSMHPQIRQDEPGQCPLCSDGQEIVYPGSRK